MTRAIISMSETLRLGTIAEGIEHPEQIQMLQHLGCEMGQGYLFAHPLRSTEMADFLRDMPMAGSMVPVPGDAEAGVPSRNLADLSALRV